MYTIALLAAILFVPLDDRPVTAQLPEMLGRIAGVRVIEPPRQLLGKYFIPGSPDAIIAWLNATAQTDPQESYVISSDMLAYGGLVASRIPATSYDDARTRLRDSWLRRSHPNASILAFGTIMRLLPTGNTQPTLEAYGAARARDYGIDRDLIEQTTAGTIDMLVLGQDDAGLVGPHVQEVHALRQVAGPHVSIEPGADELGMAFVARALARNLHWIPRIAVRYFGSGTQDPREFTTIPETIGHLITVSGGVRDDEHPDIVLYVRLPENTDASDTQLLTAMQNDEANHVSVALADLTFLQPAYDAQAAFARKLLRSGAASQLDAYASWNTDANTVGTALAEAIAANAGRRNGTYDALAHQEFTFMRFLDDYVFHDEVRSQLEATLDAQGITDHTYLLPDAARSAETENDLLLSQRAPALLAQLYPGLHIAAIRITLPWNRTFETEIEVGLAPSLPP